MTKHAILTLLACIVFTGCSKDSDGIDEQEIILSGYRMDKDGSMEADVFRFVFFPYSNISYATSKNPTRCSTYEDYIRLEEDDIYTGLIDKNQFPGINSQEGEVVPAPLVFIDDQTIKNGSMQIKLPVGRYSVFAFRHERGTDKRIWNKYGSAELNLTSGNEPLNVKCILPVDYTFFGRSMDTDFSLLGKEEWLILPGR